MHNVRLPYVVGNGIYRGRWVEAQPLVLVESSLGCEFVGKS
jgi:hypothetical protein